MTLIEISLLIVAVVFGGFGVCYLAFLDDEENPFTTYFWYSAGALLVLLVLHIVINGITR